MSMLRGAIPSPRHKLAAATPHILGAYNPFFCPIPSQISFWLNDRDGDCVTAEEAAAKAVYSVAAGIPEIFIPDNVVSAFIRKYHYANGAALTDVMDTMASVGLTDATGKVWKDGPYQSVDWTDYPTLCSAINQGPVKLGVAASQIERVATPGTSGWFLTKANGDNRVDHCTNASQCGEVGALAEAFKVTCPSSIQTDPAIGMFTWKSFGIVIHDALLGVCTKQSGEAWLRTPTTLGQPTPTPIVVPDVPAPPPLAGPVMDADRSIIEAAGEFQGLIQDFRKIVHHFVPLT